MATIYKLYILQYAGLSVLIVTHPFVNEKIEESGVELVSVSVKV